MKTEYILRGLTCASCSAKIETEIGRIGGISAAGVCLLDGESSLLKVESNGAATDLSDEIERIVHKHEPGVSVIPRRAEVHGEHGCDDHDHVIIRMPLRFAKFSLEDQLSLSG